MKSADLHERFAQELSRVMVDSGVRLLQIGAGDGRRHDPIFGFMKRNSGAQGVFIEPMLEYFEALVQNYHDKVGSTFLNLAVTPEGGERVIHFVDPAAVASGVVPAWAFGISSLLPNRNAISGALVSEDSFAKIREHVRTRRIHSISSTALIEAGLDRGANVYVSDCEGMDADILMAMPSTFRPKVLLMEWMLLDTEEGDALVSFLNPDYELLSDGIDLLCVRRKVVSQ